MKTKDMTILYEMLLGIPRQTTKSFTRVVGIIKYSHIVFKKTLAKHIRCIDEDLLGQ
jgi:hypothetical protein